MTMVTWQDIYDAYRKLKAHVYYENSSLFLREKIAKFERDNFYPSDTNNDVFKEFKTVFQDIFRGLYELLNESVDNKTNKSVVNVNEIYFNDLLKKVDILVIPKTIDPPETSNERLITNVPSKSGSTLSSCNYLIDAPIELHVLSVLWIMKVGIYLNEVCPECNYAYRLNTITEASYGVASKTKNVKKVVDGVGLFKPYYIGYKSWRDNGLHRVIRELDDKKPAILLSLDITRYYYSVRLNVITEVEDALEKCNINTTSKARKLCIALSERIQEIHSVSAKKLSRYMSIDYDEMAEFLPLPVGLLSSGILANYYLRDFDRYITEYITPEYYGRYVDDIIMVFSGKKINLSEKDKSKSPIDSFIKTTLIRQDNDYPSFRMVDNSTDYFINTQHGELRIQNKKIFMEYFLPGESRVAINKFKRRLEEASSEYRLLPFESRIDEEFDNEAYNLEYNNSIQKLRSLKGISEDRYGASKFLAQKIFLSMLPFDPDDKDEEMTKKSVAQILTYFQGYNTLSMNGLWEKVATYFVVNKDIYSLKKFYAQVLEAIEKMEIDLSNDNICDQTDIKMSIVKNMKRHLHLSFAMAFALNPESLTEFFGKKKVEKLKNRNSNDQEYCVYQEIEACMYNIRLSYLFRHQYQYLRGLCYTYNTLFNNNSLLGREMLSRPIHELVSTKTLAPYLSPVFLKMEDIASLVLINRLSNEKCNG